MKVKNISFHGYNITIGNEYEVHNGIDSEGYFCAFNDIGVYCTYNLDGGFEIVEEEETVSEMLKGMEDWEIVDKLINSFNKLNNDISFEVKERILGKLYVRKSGIYKVRFKCGSEAGVAKFYEGGGWYSAIASNASLKESDFSWTSKTPIDFSDVPE